MVTHPAPGNNYGTLVNALLNYNKENLSDIMKKIDLNHSSSRQRNKWIISYCKK